MSKLKQTKFAEVLQELEKEYLIVMTKYLSKLHDAFHEDNGFKASHEDLVDKIKQDGISMCSNNLARIAFDDRTEEEVIGEILQYNYDVGDVKRMKEVEGLNLYSIANQLNEFCMKRTEPAWFQFGIHDLIQSGKVDPGTVGINRPQFCIHCGEEVYLSTDHNTHASKHVKGSKTLIEFTELDSIINEVRSELRSILIKRRELIEKLGFALEKAVSNKENISEEIKNCLKEEIALGIISTRTIEQHCRPEWKKKTRPKHENEIFSFSQSKPEEEDQRQREIIIDNHGNPMQENHYNDSSQKADFRQDEKEITYQNDELLDRLHRTVKELIFENKKIRQEKDEIQARLGEALESLHVQKQRESELLRKEESAADRLEQHQNVFDTEFTIDYRLLQKYMAQIYKSTERQEVWFTAKIDANKKKVVSAQIGRKLLSQNITESGK